MAHLDGFGHGTHLASIIAGRDAAGTPSSYLDPARFTGIAPDATLVNVKVGASNGAVDVTQVIAGIDWVVEHAQDAGLNIRVINLSYGTDSVQGSSVDPLAYAVENAWKHGIVVVVAGGNDGDVQQDPGQPGLRPARARRRRHGRRRDGDLLRRHRPAVVHARHRRPPRRRRRARASRCSASACPTASRTRRTPRRGSVTGSPGHRAPRRRRPWPPARQR